MSDPQNHSSGQSLPPCSELLQGFSRCRVPGCNAFFSSRGQCLQHEQTCDVAMERTRNLASLAYRPGNFPVQPHRLETHFAATSIDTDSDEGSIVFTPDNSRAPSFCDPQERRQSGVIRTVPRRYRSDSSTPETERRHGESGEPKRLKKQEKEKHNRSELASVLYRMEDFFRNYCGWEKREQSGGNGNGAGLFANKSTILRGMEDLLCWYIDRDYRQGLADGTLKERQRAMREVLDASANKEPYVGTLMDPQNEEICTHLDSKAKECLTHGHPDWRECRRMHIDARFQAARDAYLEELEQLRMHQEGFLRSRGSHSRPSSSSTQRRGFPSR